MMERLRILPAGTIACDAEGFEYAILMQSKDDTLLRKDNCIVIYIVVSFLITTDLFYPEDFIHGTSYPSTGGVYFPVPFVTWKKEHTFPNEDEAIRFIQNRHMEVTGAKLCYPPTSLGDRCPACQYFESCQN